ncbi:hypothetical protein ACWEVP_33690 [Amycolatopsis sp. NPDC003865]
MGPRGQRGEQADRHQHAEGGERLPRRRRGKAELLYPPMLRV